MSGKRSRSGARWDRWFLFFMRMNRNRSSREQFPWKLTWLGEHNQESDMAFYATPAGEEVIGPGISRCEYGGFVLSYPPYRMVDIWKDRFFNIGPVQGREIAFSRDRLQRRTAGGLYRRQAAPFLLPYLCPQARPKNYLSSLGPVFSGPADQNPLFSRPGRSGTAQDGTSVYMMKNLRMELSCPWGHET